MQLYPPLMTAAGSAVNGLHFGRRLSAPFILTQSNDTAYSDSDSWRIKKTKQSLTLRNHVLTTSSDRGGASFDTRCSFLGPPVTLCSTFYVALLWHLCRFVSCIFHISAIQRVAAGFCSPQPFGMFSCAPLRISHCLDSLW